MADDDPDDRLLTKEALEENQLNSELNFVRDGVELMDYLNQKKSFNKTNAPKPDLILLDLNMPKMDGREALREIKENPNFKRIPVIVLTTSKAEADIINSYDLGVNSFISKPVLFNDLVEVTRQIGKYWFEVVNLPNN
jgi:CheY-like chemotaxis protein